MMNNVSTDPIKKYGSFFNSLGITYQVHGLSPTLPEKIAQGIDAEFERAGKLPKKPTYIITTVAGEREEHEHDESTLVVPGDEAQTKINQANYSDYSQKQNALETEYNLRLMKAVLLSVVATPTQAWRDEMKFLGVVTPLENSLEERYHFVETEVIRCPEDLTKIMTAVFVSSGAISEDAVKSVEATFQRAVERSYTETGITKPKAKRVGGRGVLHTSGVGPLLERKAE